MLAGGEEYGCYTCSASAWGYGGWYRDGRKVQCCRAPASDSIGAGLEDHVINHFDTPLLVLGH